MNQHQKTIKNKMTLTGIGVHSGKKATLNLYPAQGATGIRFYHSAYNNLPIIIGTIIPECAQHATVLKNNEWSISTVEHLLAAISALGIDNIDIVIDSNEVPIFDGSAAPFVYAFYQTGLLEQPYKKKYLTPKNAIILQDNQGRSLTLSPLKKSSLKKNSPEYLSIEYTADFNHPALTSQKLSYKFSEENFTQEIAPARTFGFLEQLSFLRQKNLALGSSLGNTLVFSQEKALTKMRYDDEYIRHKVLDLLGDIALLGLPIRATIEARKTSHDFNRALTNHYLTQQSSWDILEY